MANERKFVQENIRRVLLKEYMMEKTRRAGFGGVDIQRTPMGTRITLITERPGFVIGRKGGAIKDLTEAVKYNFKFDNPQIEVQEVENSSLNAQIMAEKLASSLERGWHFRRAGHSTVRRIMEAGAKGCQVIMSGKLTGERHRTEKYKEGHIKFCGEPRIQWMHEGFAVAKLKAGVIGVTVQIMDPNAKLPDEIEIRIPSPETEKEEKKEAEKAVQEARRDERRDRRDRGRRGDRQRRKGREQQRRTEKQEKPADSDKKTEDKKTGDRAGGDGEGAEKQPAPKESDGKSEAKMKPEEKPEKPAVVEKKGEADKKEGSDGN